MPQGFFSHPFSGVINGIAAELTRQILVEQARTRVAAKRDAGARKLSLDEAPIFSQKSQKRAADLVALDDAMTALATFDERKAPPTQRGRSVTRRRHAGRAGESESRRMVFRRSPALTDKNIFTLYGYLGRA